MGFSTPTDAADAVLKFCEEGGLTPAKTAIVAAAVLCATVEDATVAHLLVDKIDKLAKEADSEGGA